MSADPEFEERLKPHLQRLEDQKPSGLEDSVLARIHAPNRLTTWRATAAVVLLIAVLASLFVLISGHETLNLYSNLHP